jgi:Ca2+:H+ antiporter
LIPIIPVAWALHFSHQSDVIVFVFTFIAVIPLASLLSFATEQLALRMGDALGGLLNATFGNAVELLISILALVKGEIGLVQASMIGSILSNTLLVLGYVQPQSQWRGLVRLILRCYDRCCFFAGGLRFHEQIYAVSASQLQISLLGISVRKHNVKSLVWLAFDTDPWII